MTDFLKCNHCGFECKGLTLHLKYKHSQTPKEYREQFPDAEIFSKSVRKQMSASNPLKGTTCTFEERYGDRADEIKAKIGKSQGRLEKERNGLDKQKQ
ncbi:hypothetical protein [Acinetobacter sp.]|uniref:hypothetical protein n=1 Tax=Acinetobacter sp. TaxID=472 RepID=UPI00388D4142